MLLLFRSAFRSWNYPPLFFFFELIPFRELSRSGKLSLRDPLVIILIRSGTLLEGHLVVTHIILNHTRNVKQNFEKYKNTDKLSEYY